MFKSSAPTNRVRQQAVNHRFTTAAHQPFDYGIEVWCFVYDNFLSGTPGAQRMGLV